MHEKGRNPWQVPLHRDGSATKGTQNVAGIPLLDVDWVDLSLYGTRENKVAIYSQTIDILHVELEAKLYPRKFEAIKLRCSNKFLINSVFVSPSNFILAR